MEKNFKRFLSWLMVLAMVLSMMPTSVFATEPDNELAVAQVGETKYATLQAAVKAAHDGETITVIADHELTWDGEAKVDGLPVFVAVEGKPVTIDLNGKKITGNSGTSNNEFYAAFAVDNDGKLTLKDSAGGGSVKITGNNTMYSLLMAYEYGEKKSTNLTVEGGSYYLENAHDCLIYCGQKADDLVNIQGGTFELGNVGTGENGKPWIFNVYGAGDNSACVTGGTFNANVQRQFWANEVKVPETHYVENSGDGTWTVKDGATLYVKEGILTGPYYIEDWSIGYASLEAFIAAANADPTDTIDLDDPVTLVNDVSNYKADGYKLVSNGDGTWTVHEANYVAEVNGTYYESLKEALEACTNGETVKLIADITYGEEDIVPAHGGATGFGNYDASNPSIIYIGGTKGATAAQNQPSNVNAVLDLNGYAIVNNADAYMFLIMDNAKVTFTDSVGTGSITTNTETPVIWVTGTDTLVTIEGGKYTTDNAGGLLWSTHAGDLVITGGEFSTTADDASLLIVRNERDRNNANYFISGKATVAVTGGTYHGFNPEVMLDDSTTPYTEFNAVPFGYKAVEKEDGSWTVKEAVYVAQIGETKYETLAEALDEAKNDEEVKILAAGTYALSTSGKNITITGAVDGVVFDNIGAKNMGGANVTFNNVTFDYYPNVNYTGLQHSGNLVYNNCTINGQVFLYGTSETFNECTFNQNSADAYNVWTYSAKEVAFNKCTFNCAGKSVLVYNEGTCATDLTVTESKFIASTPVEGKAAIEIDTTSPNKAGGMDGTTITIDGKTTATGFGTGSVSGSSLWNDKKDQTNLTVTVDNEKVWPKQPSATIGHGLQTIVNSSKPRESVTFTVEDVYAKQELKVELWSGETKLSTTTLRQADLDDATKLLYPAEGQSTVNIVVSGEESGSWNTVWHVTPTVENIPDTIKVYVDGSTEPADTYTKEGGVFLNDTEKEEYLALLGVKKSYIESAYVGDQDDRESIKVDMYYVYAKEELKVELYSGETLMATTTLNQYDADDTEKTNPYYPASGTYTANMVIWGREAGSWTTEWKVDPTIDLVPTKVVVYTDGNKAAEKDINLGDAYKNLNAVYVNQIKADLLEGKSVTLERNITVDNSFLDSIPAKSNGNGKYGIAYGSGGVFNVIGKEVTFDLNDHSITYEDSHSEDICNKAVVSLFYATDGSNLTITGEGNVTTYGMANGVYSVAANTKVTIEGGNWNNYPCEECGAYNFFLYASHGGELYIKDGTFNQNANPSYLIVEHGSTKEGTTSTAGVNYSLTKVEVSGGTFVGMNPEKAVFIDEGNGQQISETNVCADGYKAVENEDGSWTVKEAVYVAQIGETKYETLAEALDKAQSGEKVELLQSTSEKYVVVKDGITLDLNGYALTAGNVVGFGASHIIDSSDLQGRLVTGKDDVVLNKQNAMLPVYDGDAYVFAGNTLSALKVTSRTDTSVKLSALPAPVMAIVERLKDGAADNNLEICIRLTWSDGNDGTNTMDLTFNEETIKSVYSSNKGSQLAYGSQFYMVITGLEGVSNMKANVVIKSGTGAECVSSKTLQIVE